ncbi:MAG: hypothetical protein AAFY12_11885 [Pseudomonadota bacterium]
MIGEAWQADRKLERNLTMTAAYMTARLGFADPKKFPDLKDFLGDDEEKKVEQTSDEFATAFLTWAIKHGLKEDDDAST